MSSVVRLFSSALTLRSGIPQLNLRSGAPQLSSWYMGPAHQARCYSLTNPKLRTGPHEVLGLATNATQKEIEEAYRAARQKASSQGKLQEIEEAYRVLREDACVSACRQSDPVVRVKDETVTIKFGKIRETAAKLQRNARIGAQYAKDFAQMAQRGWVRARPTVYKYAAKTKDTVKNVPQYSAQAHKAIKNMQIEKYGAKAKSMAKDVHTKSAPVLAKGSQIMSEILDKFSVLLKKIMKSAQSGRNEMLQEVVIRNEDVLRGAVVVAGTCFFVYVAFHALKLALALVLYIITRPFS